MKTKYTATFEYVITAKDIKSIDSFNISEASQKDLGKYLPNFVDFSKSEDLLGIAFDVAVANMFNKNGDGISSMGAIKMLPTLYHKPINIEHNRDTIIGHTLTASLTDRDFKKMLMEEDVAKTNLPFNITVGGVLYKIVAKELGKLLMDIQNGKEMDFSVASSWEVGFDKFYAAVGSNKLSECQIVTDESKVNELSKYMKTFGGKGFNEDGLAVNRLISPEGTVVFLGAGLTKYPAADVGPVYVFDNSEEENNDIEEEENVEMVENISHLKKNDVIDLRSDINNIMTKEEIATLIQEAVKASVDSKTFDQESVASTTAKIADAIIESNKQFIAEKEQAEAKAKEIEAKAKEQEEKIASLESKISETSESLKQATEKLAEIEQEKLAALATQKFNERMSIVDELFALEDADREIIAKQISSLSSDEEFDGLKKNLEVLMSAKLKSKIQEAKAAQEQIMQEALAQELKKRGLTDPLEAKQAEVTGDIPNNSAAASEVQPTLREKFSKAFDKNKIKVII